VLYSVEKKPGLGSARGNLFFFIFMDIKGVDSLAEGRDC
jgi:hypothetical protein